MKVGRHLPAIHRSPTTIIFLRMTLLTTLLEKVRKGGKSKEPGVRHQFHMLKNSFSLPRVGFIQVGSLLEQKRQPCFRELSEQVLFCKSLI